MITGKNAESYVRLMMYALNLKYRVDLLKIKQILRQCFLYYKSTFIGDIVSLHISQIYNLSTKIFVQRVPVERCPLVGHNSYPQSRLIRIFSRMWEGHG